MKNSALWKSKPRVKSSPHICNASLHCWIFFVTGSYFQVTTLFPGHNFASKWQLCFQVTTLFPGHSFVSSSQLCFQVTTLLPGHNFVSRSQLFFQVTDSTMLGDFTLSLQKKAAPKPTWKRLKCQYVFCSG